MQEYSRIIKSFYEFEDEHNLLNWKIQGVKIWLFLRTYIIKEILKEKNIHDQDHTKKTNLSYLLTRFPSLLINSLIRNPFFGRSKNELIFFNAGRKKKYKNDLIDIYTQFIINDLSDTRNYKVYEEPYLLKHFGKPTHKTRYLDYLFIKSFIKSFIVKPRFNTQETNAINQLITNLNEFFEIKISLQRMIERYIVIFKSDYALYTKLFLKKSPAAILMVNSYFLKKPMIAAAKNLNIPTIELQHGTIGDLEVGYHFPYQKNNEVEYFPDYFLSFGELWTQKTKLPINQNKVILYGFPYFNKIYDLYQNVSKIKAQIIFISQGPIGKNLSDIAFDVAKKLPGFTILFKLHPGEYDRWKNEYPALIKLNELKNTEVIDTNETNLYNLLASSQYLVGVYSTAIFEGVALNCKTFVADLPGVEYMESLIEKNVICKFSNAEEFINKRDTFSPSEISSDYIFHKETPDINFVLDQLFTK